jgi:hypothetical protein
MRLANATCRTEGATPHLRRFEVRWSASSHARRIVLPATVSVSEAVHPFCVNPFRGFAVPHTIID